MPKLEQLRTSDDSVEVVCVNRTFRPHLGTPGSSFRSVTSHELYYSSLLQLLWQLHNGTGLLRNLRSLTIGNVDFDGAELPGIGDVLKELFRVVFFFIVCVFF